MEKPRSDDVTILQGLAGEGRGPSLHTEPGDSFPYVPFSALSGRPDPHANHPTDPAPRASRDMASALHAESANDDDEAAHPDAERNWNAMLDALKEYVERGTPRVV